MCLVVIIPSSPSQHHLNSMVSRMLPNLLMQLSSTVVLSILMGNGLVIAKSKVAPIKRLTIPRLELCGALILARMLNHLKPLFDISYKRIYAWTDSTIVLNWIASNPRRFKTVVCNRVSEITELIPPDCWRHVSGQSNQADCASRGLWPSELVDHSLWWNGPAWLRQDSSFWPEQGILHAAHSTEEERNICLSGTAQSVEPVMSIESYSSYSMLRRTLAWVFRFIRKCRKHASGDKSVTTTSHYLTVEEMKKADDYLASLSQRDHFEPEMRALMNGHAAAKSSCLFSLSPFLDESRILRVGGRRALANEPYDSIHPVILHGKHPLTRLMIRTEHIRLFHG